MSKISSCILDAEESASLKTAVQEAKCATSSSTEKGGVETYDIDALSKVIPKLELCLSSAGKEEGQAAPAPTKLQELRENLLAAVRKWKQAEAGLLPREGDALPPGYEATPTEIRVATSEPSGSWGTVTLWNVSAVNVENGLLEHIVVDDDPREKEFQDGSRTLESSTYRYEKDRTTFRLVNPEDYGPGRYLYDPLRMTIPYTVASHMCRRAVPCVEEISLGP